MDQNKRQQLVLFVEHCLQKKQDFAPVGDGDSLFISGRLDSLSVTQLVVFLEQTCAIDFSQVDFDLSLIDSIDEIERFVDSATTASK